jgi:hypothetical protein
MATLVGTCTATRMMSSRSTETISMRFTSDASGNVTHVIEGGAVRGTLYTLRTIPISGLSADWDVVLEDFEATDWLRGKGADRSASATDMVYLYDDDDPEVPIKVADTLRLQVTNAGASAVAIVEIVVHDVRPATESFDNGGLIPPPIGGGDGGPAGPPGGSQTGPDLGNPPT